jgi:mannose/fructose/N-acetylgalactosamine-specific phosphotransferase system component IIC
MIVSEILGILLGSILWMDRVFMFQFMISRPMIMAPLVGLIMGDVWIGILVGASLELIWLNAPPVGSYLPNDESFCAAVAVPVAVYAGGSMSTPSAAGFSILMSIPFSLVGRALDMHIRTVNERLIPVNGEIGEKDVGWAMKKALVRAFLFALVSIGACTATLTAVVVLLRNYLPGFILTSFSYMPFMCIIAGISVLVSKEVPRRIHIGMFILGAILILALTWIL